MSFVVESLSLCIDKRNDENGNCDFNGYLEDYVGMIEEHEDMTFTVDVFRRLLDIDKNYRILVNFEITCNQDTIANQVIRYKDAFKLPDGQLKIPYLLYTLHDEIESGIICSFGDKAETIYAKGAYLVLSEPGSKYSDIRNDLVSVAFNEELLERQLELIERVIVGKDKAGYIQRGLDNLVFTDIHDMVKTAQDISNKLCNEEVQNLKTQTDIKIGIYKLIEKWFYLKKFVYVATMSDRSLLMNVYGNDRRKLRQAAKQNSDSIHYVSYSECWRRTLNKS